MQYKKHITTGGAYGAQTYYHSVSTNSRPLRGEIQKHAAIKEDVR